MKLLIIFFILATSAYADVHYALTDEELDPPDCGTVERVYNGAKKERHITNIIINYEDRMAHIQMLDPETIQKAKEAEESKGELLFCESRVEGKKTYLNMEKTAYDESNF